MHHQTVNKIEKNYWVKMQSEENLEFFSFFTVNQKQVYSRDKLNTG